LIEAEILRKDGGEEFGNGPVSSWGSVDATQTGVHGLESSLIMARSLLKTNTAPGICPQWLVERFKLNDTCTLFLLVSGTRYQSKYVKLV
jgi:hypothetical protein